MINPYSETLREEVNGVKYPNPLHLVWQIGYSAGFDDCLTAFEKNLDEMENLLDHGATTEQIIDKLVEATRATAINKEQ